MNFQVSDDAKDDDEPSSGNLSSKIPKQSLIIGAIVGGVLGTLLALFILWLVREKPQEYDPELLKPVPVLLPAKKPDPPAVPSSTTPIRLKAPTTTGT